MTKQEAKNLNPIFEIRPEYYYLAQWFVGGSGNHDVLAMAWRTPDNQWHARIRYRAYLDDKNFRSEDKKEVWDFQIPPNTSEEEVFKVMSKCMEGWAVKTDQELTIIEGRCGGQEFADKFMQVPRTWTHIDELPLEKEKENE